MTSKKLAFTPISKKEILSTFKSHVKANSKIISLIDSLADIFSKDALEPENYGEHQLPNSREIFVPLMQASRTFTQQQTHSQNYNQRPAQIRKFLPKSPFSSANLSVNTWWYLDEEGNTQGPFTTAQMDQWYNDEFFPNNLQIKTKEEERFRRMIDLLGKEQEQSKNFYRQSNQGQNRFQHNQNIQGNDNKGWERAKNINKEVEGLEFRRNLSDNKSPEQSSMQITRNISSSKDTQENLKPLEEKVEVKKENEKLETIEEKPVNQEKISEAKNEVTEQIQTPIEEKTQIEANEEKQTESQQKLTKTEETSAHVEPEKTEKIETKIQKEDLFGGEWKVSYSKNLKGKKGKGSKKATQQTEPEEEFPKPIRIEPETKKKEEAKEEIQDKSPSKPKDGKKKLITTWAEETKPPKPEKPAIEELSATPDAFPSLADVIKPTTKAPTKVATKEKAKIEEQKQVKKVSENPASQEEFPSLASHKPNVEELKPKATQISKQKQEKAQPVETNPKKETPPIVNEDFPTLGGKDDFPNLGQSSKPKQGNNAPKKNTAKPQYVPLDQPKKTAPTVTKATKEDLSKNPKYIADFPSL